jgi:hypothetical protein
MNDFMVLVERAVRPVVAGPRRKLRMREELLAHLTGVYEEELARLGDAAAARAEAARRLGDPTQLTRDLEASLTVGDRIDGRLDRWFGWRPGEAPWRYALRLAGLAALVILPFCAAGLVVAEVRRPADPSVPSAATFLRIAAGMLLLGTALPFFFGLAVAAMQDVFRGEPRRPGSGARAGWSVLLLAFAVPASMAGVWLVALSDQPEAMAMLAPRNAGEWLINGLSTLAIPLVAVSYARSTAAAAARRVEWARLDLGA